MERVSVSAAVMNKVLAVLQQLPYHQVAAIIAELQADAKPEEESTNADFD